MFRIVPSAEYSADMNMALDETVMEGLREGDGTPTIRLYGWKPAAVSIGYFQCLTDEVDVERCKQDGIQITRRMTGGGAVYHDAEITYSVIAPQELFAQDMKTSYGQIIKPVMQALKELGVESKFRPVNDILVGDQKISGNAQTRKGGVLLQHGTILLSVDAKKMFSYLTPDKSKLSDKPFIKSVNQAVTSLEEHGISFDDMEGALRKSLTKAFKAQERAWSQEELERAKEIAEKYRSESWVGMR